MNSKEKEAKRIEELRKEIQIVVDKADLELTVADDDYDYVNYSTDLDGDKGSEECSPETYAKVQKIEEFLRKNYRGELSVDTEEVDEFVYLNIEFKTS